MDGWDVSINSGSGYSYDQQQQQSAYGHQPPHSNNGGGYDNNNSPGYHSGYNNQRDQGWSNSPRRGGRGGNRSGGYHQGGRGGGGGGGGGGYHQQQQQQQQQHSAEQREENRVRHIRSQLFKLGEDKDFHPPSDLLKMARWIEDKAADGTEPITNAFRVMVTEQPHKTPLVAALIGFLCLQQQPKPAPPRNPDDDDVDQHDSMQLEPAQADSLGIVIVKDLVKAFRSYLDARLWRNTRLTLHLFAALVPLHIIPAASLRTLLGSFAAVLEEPAVAAARADRAAMCIIETLCRAGQDLLIDQADSAQAELDHLVAKVVAYDSARKVEVELTQPVHDLESIWLEGFPDAVKSLEQLRAREYKRPAFLPVPSDLLPAAISPSATQVAEEKRVVTLPEVLVPPEEDAEDQGLDVAYAQLGEGQVKRRKLDTGKGELEEKKAAVGSERVSLQPRWFNNTVPKAASPASVVLRAILADMIDLYEVNRKEAAKLILDLPNWLRRGTFTSKVSSEAGLFGEVHEGEVLEETGYSLDDLLVETILSTALLLPTASRNPLYYTSLLREIVSLTPSTVAPSLGRTIRTFYNALSTPSMDVESVRRFADWFAIHLSNFNFGWAWKEWIPDTSLPSNHPKIVFMKRIVELEIRLAYFDRIKETLPEEIQAVAMSKQEPSPVFTYADESHPYYEQAARLVNSIKAKASAEIVLADFETFKNSIYESSASTIPSESGEGMVSSPLEADVVVRDLTIQCVLQVGSRSFSHFLNIVERYHSLLRQLSRSPRMRAAILAGSVRFWTRSQQWIHIVVDKLLQYRIVEPADVVDFIFSPPTDEPSTILSPTEEKEAWAGFNTWTLLRLTLEKVNGRVDQLKKRLEEIERKEAEEREKKEAALAAGLPLDEVEEKKQEDEEEQLPLFPTSATLPVRPAKDGGNKAELSSMEALASLDAIKSEQRKVLVGTINGFKNLIVKVDDEGDEWEKWWINGWYKQLVRAFNKQLLENRETVLSNCFGGSTGGDEELVEGLREFLERAIDILSE
ncbi:related to 80 kDa nuclear cap binding protein [Melanopsichium pennsylvanicum]|uniref:Related to 80 kDa nuclear cap binding protein n=2 Tax=Melanopsichium pennsylvanicum TaxID=63383 RepID=A0AAJ4XRK8_9BASI|nr:related to 80 kDa nuclear cap binding protein [Melanopsichium pennsylvanicum 4]SNX87969.1 related to 80 kDa nuclear cap binding protein [Melanopsichium pennsylvanicum]